MPYPRDAEVIEANSQHLPWNRQGSWNGFRLSTCTHHEPTQRRSMSCRAFKLLREHESFSDFYVWLQNATVKAEVCQVHSSTCQETQLKIVIIMEGWNKQLVQKFISLDMTTSLQDVVNKCLSYESKRKAISFIRVTPFQLHTIYSYKSKRDAKTHLLLNPFRCQLLPAHPVYGRSNEVNCLAVESKYCGRQGPWA